MAERAVIDRPIFVIGCSRSGTTLLFRNLCEHPVTWSLYEESPHIFYEYFPLDREQGDRVAISPTPALTRAIHHDFFRAAHNKEILCDRRMLRHVPRKILQRPLNRLYKRAPLRLVEKTPANCLRVPFLAKLFPDARFVYLVRHAEDVVSSLMEGWKNWSGTGNGTWRYGEWHYLVPPGWREWVNRSLQEICAFQWVQANRTAWHDLKEHCADRFVLVRHEDTLAKPQESYAQVLEFTELPPSPFFDTLIATSERRVYTHGGSRPRAGKWQHVHGPEVESVRHMFQGLMDELYPELKTSPR